MPTRVLVMFLAITTTVLGILLVRNQRAQAAQSTQATAQTQQLPTSLILQEGDGERRLRRPGGQLVRVPFLSSSSRLTNKTEVPKTFTSVTRF